MQAEKNTSRVSDPEELAENKPESPVVGSMPSPLFASVLSSFGLGICLALICSILLIIYGGGYSGAFLPGILIGAFLVVRGIIVQYKWTHGIIEEYALKCISTKWRYKAVKITCADLANPDETKLYEFTLSRTKDKIEPGSTIIIYVDKTNPRIPAAWKVL